MLDRYDCLRKLAARRGEGDVVVTTMSVAMPWASLSDGPLDFAHVDSAMGHAADLALGIAMAQRRRSVWCLNGDGSMLMSLGTLVTIVESGVQNLVLFVMNNGGYLSIRKGKWKLELCAGSGGWSYPKPNTKQAKALPAVRSPSVIPGRKASSTTTSLQATPAHSKPRR